MKKLVLINCLLLTALLLNAKAYPCSQSNQEITFVSGSFKIVGDLKLPDGKGPHPVILFVHGSGPTDRTSGSGYLPIMEKMLHAGYATFAWDKPGTGESTGQIDQSRLIEQRSQIVLDAIETIKKNPLIDKSKIGLWGVSQAGYIMPVVISKSKDISFMIAVSCPGEPGVNQGAYFISRQAVCAGLPKAAAKEVEDIVLAIESARTYDEYVENKKKLLSVPSISTLTNLGLSTKIKPRAEWQADDLTGSYYWNPMEIVETIKIPVLAFFGENDTQADPVQGVLAYNEALQKAGNTKYRVELIKEADHSLFISETGCPKEQNTRSVNGLNKYSPAYLSILEEWLKQLKDN